MIKQTWAWLWKEQWWHRCDRSAFSRFMDFYCERLYPVLMLGLLVLAVVANR